MGCKKKKVLGEIKTEVRKKNVKVGSPWSWFAWETFV